MTASPRSRSQLQAPSGTARASSASVLENIYRRWKLGHESSVGQTGPLCDLYPCLHRAWPRPGVKAVFLFVGVSALPASHRVGCGATELKMEPRLGDRGCLAQVQIRRYPMRKTIITAAALVLLSPAVIPQSTDTKSPATTRPAAQSDSRSKGDMSKDKMSKKKMAKSKSTKMKKTGDKM